MADDAMMNHIVELKGQLGELRQAVVAAEVERMEARSSQEVIKEKLNTISGRLSTMSDTDHKRHHEMLERMIEEMEQRNRIREAILNKLITGGVWAFFAAVAALAWLGLSAKLGFSVTDISEAGGK